MVPETAKMTNVTKMDRETQRLKLNPRLFANSFSLYSQSGRWQFHVRFPIHPRSDSGTQPGESYRIFFLIRSFKVLGIRRKDLHVCDPDHLKL